MTMLTWRYPQFAGRAKPHQQIGAGPHDQVVGQETPNAFEPMPHRGNTEETPRKLVRESQGGNQ
jgi:hypothetical protein